MAQYAPPVAASLSLLRATLPAALFCGFETELSRRIQQSQTCSCSMLMRQVHCCGELMCELLLRDSCVEFPHIAASACGPTCVRHTRVGGQSSPVMFGADSNIDCQNIGLVFLYVFHAIYENALLCVDSPVSYYYAWLCALLSRMLGASNFFSFYLSECPRLCGMFGNNECERKVLAEPWHFTYWYKQLMTADMTEQVMDLVVPVVSEEYVVCE